MGGAKTVFLSHLHINAIFLPRQARDKHRKNSKTDRFSQGLTAQLQWAASAPILKWSTGSSWRKAGASVSELYANFYTAPPPPPGTR
eukprot:COSAG06_NODE_1291_length_9980_cov_166.860237_2_plen_87_part_00